MKCERFIFGVALACLACAASFAEEPPARPGEPAAEDGFFLQYIPDKPFKATLMRVAFDTSASSISARFNESIAQSPEWFASYLSENAGVKPLPYHPNFGISETEYQSMLKALSHHWLERVADVPVQVEATQGGSLKIECPAMGRGFGTLQIDQRTGRLSTPWLGVEPASLKKGSGAASDGNPFGEWEGAVWKNSVSDKEKGDYKSVSLFLGRSKTAGARFLSLRVKIMEARKIKSNFETILQFQ